MKRTVAIIFAILTVACGSDTPTGPTGQSVVDVAGVWNYASTLNTVSGGDCVGAIYQTVVGTAARGTASITQSGANLTATTRSSSDGSSCQFSGTAGSNSIALGWQTCDAGRVSSIQCANGARRDIAMVTNSVNATMSGSSGTGTQAISYNVFNAGTTTGVGVLVLNASFTMTK